MELHPVNYWVDKPRRFAGFVTLRLNKIKGVCNPNIPKPLNLPIQPTYSNFSGKKMELHPNNYRAINTCYSAGLQTQRSATV
jgi:hypothetical protein